MNKDERYIAERFGRQGSFRVPDHYFDTLADRVMEKLPAEDSPARVIPIRPSLLRRLRPALSWVAASMAAACCGAMFLLHTGGKPERGTQGTTSTEQVAASSWASFDAMADYTMTDADEMYAYMSDNE